MPITSPPDPQLDPVSVVQALMTVLVGGTLAHYIGAYLVIGAAGIFGAGFGLSRWRECSRIEAFVYIAGFTLLALLFTVPAAELSQQFMPASWSVPTRWLLAPLAVLISGIGHEWPDVGRWVLQRAGRLLDAVLSRKTGGAA